MPWQFITADDIGGRSEQQDRCAVVHAEHAADNLDLAVLADGVGGHGNGSQAAQTVIDVAQRMFDAGALVDPDRFLDELCQEAHRAILDLERDANGISCSTCVFLLLHGREAWWAHVGDSRLYLLRGGRALLQTVDHSMYQLELDAGVDPADIKVGRNQLYMSLGGKGEVEPSFGSCRVQPDDAFLLCSDGLWGQVEITEMARLVDAGHFDAVFADEWVQKARLEGGKRGDNISLVLARFGAMRRGWLARLLGGIRKILGA